MKKTLLIKHILSKVKKPQQMGKKNKLQVSSCAVNPICEDICRFTPAQWHVDFDFTHFETFSFYISENLNSSTAF